MMIIAALFILAISAFGQDGLPVSVSKGPPAVAYQGIYYYSGANLIYACYARSKTATVSTITVSAASNANPVSFTATAHGFGDFATNGATTTPVVKITGYTGNWAALNGVWQITTTSANDFTVAVDSTGFGAVTGTPVFTTQAPLWNQPVWAIQAFVYSGTNNTIFSGWAALAPGTSAAPLPGSGLPLLDGGTTGAAFKCSQRTTYGYQ